MSALSELERKKIYELTRLELCVIAMRNYQGSNDVSESSAEELAALCSRLASLEAANAKVLAIATEWKSGVCESLASQIVAALGGENEINLEI